jgi:hypothetical protein
VPLYIADCDVPGITPEQVGHLVVRVRAACEACSVQGIEVRHLSTFWVPADEQLLVLFGADSPEAVRTACWAASIPFLRVVEAVEVSGASGG